jgi:hypothetical protein
MCYTSGYAAAIKGRNLYCGENHKKGGRKKVTFFFGKEVLGSMISHSFTPLPFFFKAPPQ